MAGVRVVEMGVWVAGPAAGGVLADWGADVVKIEPPGMGDPSRSFQKMFGDLPFNPIFENDNRSKRSIVIDLRRDEGRALAHELVAGADVFVTNVRQAALARHDLDHETLLARHPRLVYGAITGYGLEGPDKDRAAYDIAGFWARSGIANALTSPSSPHPPFQRGGMGDHTAGMNLAGGISAALYAREKSGRGQLVSTSLLRTGLYTLSFDLSIAIRFGVPIAVADRKAMGNPAINCYRDKEGRWFWIVGLEGERHWPPLCRSVGHPEWIDDERFATAEQRAANAAELITLLDEIFATKTRAEWGAVFDAEEDMWWAPVQNTDEVVADPQVHAAGGFVEVPDGETTTALPATPVDFGDTAWEPRAMAPDAGAQTDELLRELGRDDAAIRALRERGVVA